MPVFGRKKEVALATGPSRRPGPPPLLARTGRFGMVVFVVTLAFIAIATRLCWLHVVAAPRLRAQADDARRSFRELKADRGRILDSRGGVLATSHEVWDIGVDPHEFTPAQRAKLDEISEALSAVIKVPRLELLAAFEPKFKKPPEDNPDEEPRPIRWVKLAEGVDLKTRDAVDKLHVRALYSSRRFEREYPQGKLAAQLVGYVNKEGNPAMGVEKALDYFLMGEDGWIDSRKDAKGREMADRRIREVSPTDGLNVELTLDPIIQQAAEEELSKACEEFHPEWGIAIISEAKTGKLLALSNWPTFDLNEYSDPVKAPLIAQKNRAVTDVYEPGSVFKIVSYSAAIQEGLITPDTPVDCGPNHRLPFFAPYKGKLHELPKDDEYLGRIDVRKAIAKSSNRAAAQIAMRVAEAKGEDRIFEYMTGFGFGSKTGLVTGTEVRGTLLKPKEWQWSSRAATLTRMAMGHTVDVTALQTHFAMGVIASGGDLMTPLLVNRIVDKTGAPVMEFSPVLRKHTLRKETAHAVAVLLRGVVTDGTGRKADIPGYDVAGKTGTTSMLMKHPETGKLYYSDSENIASFCGFFPAGDPQLVISVIMANPKGKGQSFGGVYSAPVFKSIAERVIAWLKIPPSNPAEYEAAMAKDRKKKGLPPAQPPRNTGALILDPF